MIEIKHKDTGQVLLQVRADTLEEADLRGANLVGANLFGQDLYAADLRGADLSNAELSKAHLTTAELQNARLVGADLDGADLTSAHLEGADLHSANLSNAQLMATWLGGANLTDVTLSATIFARCYDLHQTIGLDRMRHVTDCIIDRSTLYEHICQVPDVFLVGVGYHSEEIKELRRIYGPRCLTIRASSLIGASPRISSLQLTAFILISKLLMCAAGLISSICRVASSTPLSFLWPSKNTTRSFWSVPKTRYCAKT